MQKKIIAFITSLSLVISCTAPSFAVDISTSAANSLNPSRFSVHAISGTAGTLANGDTVAPVSSSDNIYYFAGTSNSTLYKTVSSWANLMSGITQGFALSISSLNSQLKSAISSQTTSINTGLTNVEKAVDDVWDRLGIILGSVDQLEGYVDQLEGYLNSISGSVDGVEGKLDTNNTNLSNIKSDTSNIYSLLQSGVGYDTVKIGDNTSNGFSQGYLWRKYNSSNLTVPYINDSFSYIDAQTNFGTFSVLGGITAILHRSNISIARTGVGILNSVVDSDFYLTNNDLTTSNMPKKSFWYDFRSFASNISDPLHRLAFVLASQEEIEARQAASDNQTAAVDSFIKPSGSGSASATDIGEMANVSSSMSDMLGSDVSPSTAFSSMSSDSDAWSWFSQDTADSLDQRTSTRRLLKGSNKSFVSDYYKELESIIGVKLW